VRLRKLELEGFRGYRTRTEVTFEDGLNVFTGPNEAGKTGILLGIVAALFVPRSAAERDALRSSEVCTVALEYELPDQTRWRVERDLAAHKGALFEQVDGEWMPVAGAVTEIAAIVRAHTGCDEALFKSSLLVGHESVEVGWSGDVARSIEERLEAIVAGSPGGVTAARAADRLEKAKKSLTGPRQGAVARAEAAWQAAESDVRRLRSIAANLETTRERAVRLDSEVTALDAELAELEAVVAAARDVAQLEARAEDLKARRAALDRAIDAHERYAELAAKAKPQPAAWTWAVAIAGAALLVAAFVAGWPVGVAVAAVGVGAVAAAFVGARRRPQPVAPAASHKEERDRDAAERAALGRDLDELRDRIAAAGAARLPAAELARQAARLRELPAKLQARKGEAIRAELEMAQLEREAGWLAEAEDTAAAAEREVARLRRKAAAITVAHEELVAAIDDVRAGIAPRVADLAATRLRDVAPGWGVEVDPGAGIGFRAVKGAPAGLSDGTADQFHFAVRLALAEVLLGDLRPPLLLDDPFRYADATRRAALHAQLKDASSARQVLYFTVDAPADLPVTHPLATEKVTA
jgi:DNA repair exonuclease SbcCD ATPase subunit